MTAEPHARSQPVTAILEAEVRAVDGHNALELPAVDVMLAPAFSILTCLNTSSYDPAAQTFLNTPQRVGSIRALAVGVQSAGRRLQDAGVLSDEVIDRGEKIYTAQEWWTFDLAVDLIATLTAINGIEPYASSSARFEVVSFDGTWASRSKKALKHAGDGPEQLRSLRAAIPRRRR